MQTDLKEVKKKDQRITVAFDYIGQKREKKQKQFVEKVKLGIV